MSQIPTVITGVFEVPVGSKSRFGIIQIPLRNTLCCWTYAPLDNHFIFDWGGDRPCRATHKTKKDKKKERGYTYGDQKWGQGRYTGT